MTSSKFYANLTPYLNFNTMLEAATDRLGSQGEALEGQEPAPSFKNRPFSLPSSYGPDSPEVRKMDEVHRQGRHIWLYELIQGMTDYGRNHKPPPRIWIEYKSERREEFNGKAIVATEDDPVTALEFTNGGSGLSPEDTVINRHGGSDDTLGTHGKGMTLSLCHLVSHGMKVKVSSHYRGRAWSGEAALQPTESGVTKTLRMDGRWKEKSERPGTCFRIENIPQEYLKALTSAGELFLYANPRYPDAVIVAIDEETAAKVQKSVAVDGGEVMCLEGIIDHPAEGGVNYVYVEGLKVPIPYRKKSFFPWAIQGLKDPPNFKLKVRRSHDSTTVEAYNIGLPIACGVQSMQDETLLKALIQAAIKDPDNKYLELESSPDRVSIPFSKPTAEIVKEIWRELYGDALITNDKKLFALYNEFFGNERKAILVSTDLYYFLSPAGIETVNGDKVHAEEIKRYEERARQRALKEKDEKRARGELGSNGFHDLNTINVPSARAEDGLEKLMVLFAQHGVDVDLVTQKNGQFLRISIPHILKEKEQFNGQTEDTSGLLVRMAAVIAHVAKINSEIFSIEGDALHQIKIDTKEDWVNANLFRTFIDITTYERAQFVEYTSYKEGATYILFSGEQINTLHNPTRLERLVELFLKIIGELRARVEKVRKLKKGKEADGKTQDAKTEEAKASSRRDSDSVPTATVSHSGIGQIPIDLRGEIVADGSDCRSENGAESKKKNILPVGYYQKEVGTTFSYDPERKNCSWIANYRWAYAAVPEKTPKMFSSRITIRQLNGFVHLYVRPGEKIIGVEKSEDANIEFFRDVRTGLYSIRGCASEVTYYTQVDKAHVYDINPPCSDEKEDVIGRHLLLPHWRDFIEMVASNPALTVSAKIELLQQKWNETFQYSDDPALGDQEKGDSREEIAARLLNTAKGICNLSATGFALLLRAIGIPSRVCTGHWVQNEKHGGSHMWVEYWNNARWVALESQIGVKSLPSVKDKMQWARIIEELVKERPVSTGSDKIKKAIEKIPDPPKPKNTDPRGLRGIPNTRRFIYAALLAAAGLIGAADSSMATHPSNEDNFAPVVDTPMLVPDLPIADQKSNLRTKLRSFFCEELLQKEGVAEGRHK